MIEHCLLLSLFLPSLESAFHFRRLGTANPIFFDDLVSVFSRHPRRSYLTRSLLDARFGELALSALNRVCLRSTCTPLDPLRLVRIRLHPAAMNRGNWDRTMELRRVLSLSWMPFSPIGLNDAAILILGWLGITRLPFSWFSESRLENHASEDSLNAYLQE